jgi:hypothetical protein
MRTKWILLVVSIMCTTWMLRADETITVSATTSDISEDLNLKTVATLFGQAKDLEQFEAMLNNPDSAFSNLDLNADGEVDYLRVVETADGNKHLVVIQAVLAQDIYQDVASIYVEKDEKEKQVTVQVIGDEYIYGTNYIIEPVYIYRPVIYDWFWGPSWVCWHSPYYWGYWPTWWRAFHCIDPYLYWDHCYWHHYHHPICSYRTAHHAHHHYHHMHHAVRRNDYAIRYPERSFATRNASRNISNARALEQGRRTEMRQQIVSGTRTRVGSGSVVRQDGNTTGTRVRNTTYGSSNIRGNVGASTSRTQRAGNSVTTRTTGTSVSRSTVAGTPTRTASSSATVTRTNAGNNTSVRTSGMTTMRSSSTAVRTTGTNTRSTSTSTVRSTSSSTNRTAGTSTVRSTGGSSTMRTTSGMGTMRTGGSGSMRTTSGSSSRTR